MAGEIHRIKLSAGTEVSFGPEDIIDSEILDDGRIVIWYYREEELPYDVEDE